MIVAVELEVAGGESGATGGVGDSSPGGFGGAAGSVGNDDIPCCRNSAVVGIVMKMWCQSARVIVKKGRGPRWQRIWWRWWSRRHRYLL